jgi:hypothetical protein
MAPGHALIMGMQPQGGPQVTEEDGFDKKRVHREWGVGGWGGTAVRPHVGEHKKQFRWHFMTSALATVAAHRAHTSA